MGITILKLFISSPEPKAQRWAYSIPMLRRPSLSSCMGFLSRSIHNSGFYGNRELTKSYNWKNGVITFSQMFLIGAFSYLHVTMTCMRAWMSSKFGQIRPRTTELAALERCHHIFSTILKLDPFHIFR